MVLSNQTKAQLVEIIEEKEKEILDLKEDLRLLEKCEKYDDLTDEIKGVFDKLRNKDFSREESLNIVETMLASGHIPPNQYYRAPYRGYRPY
jgi:flagellar motility protein MotE (MotC chaperone)